MLSNRLATWPRLALAASLLLPAAAEAQTAPICRPRPLRLPALL
ncbi:hypothetical protein [Hymenobacter sp. BRD67]|nr:hypothetical protein [Hymenobacter sp. BRD67]